MSHTGSIIKNVAYGRNLARAGASGIRAEHRVALNGRPFSSALAEVARHSLKMAALGACIGLFHSYMTKRRGHFSRAIGCGSLGGTMGFFAGFSWNNRRVTAGLAHSAVREIRKVRDQHWLETHPIDYA